MIIHPKISVVMLTYNHKAYISAAVQSVLDQTFIDFELIIIDDGSTDGTSDIIKCFTDSRIKYFYQKNQGPSVASNLGIKESSGEFIALFSGDDICHEERLAIQFRAFREASADVAVIFSQVNVIDEYGYAVSLTHPISQMANRIPSYTNRFETLKIFFENGNHFFAPTAFARKSILLEMGLFVSTSIQLQDFILWIQILMRYEVIVLNEKLVQYRVRLSEANLSSFKNNDRIFFEFKMAIQIFLDLCDATLFRKIFVPIKTVAFHLDFEKAFLCIKHNNPHIREHGFTQFFYLLQNDTNREIAESDYSYSLQKFFMHESKLLSGLYSHTSLKTELNAIYNSTSWKITRPLRKMKLIWKHWAKFKFTRFHK